MKSNFCKLAFTAVMLVCVAAAEAAATTTPVGEPPTAGVWSKDVDLVRKRANAEGLPVFMVGSSTGCEFCSMFKSSVVNSTTFINWMAKHGENSDQPYLFLMVTAQMGNWTTGQPKKIADWITLGSLPRVSCYWYADGKEKLNAAKNVFAGRGKGASYYITWFEDKTAGYGKPKTDEWDPADDTASGATRVEPDVTSGLDRELKHGPHTLFVSANDRADWFKMPVKSGVRYRVALDGYSCDGKAPAIVLSNAVAKTTLTAEQMKAGHVFEANVTGDLFIQVAAGDDSTKASYSLSYRVYPKVVFEFAATSYNVKEDKGSVKLTVRRTSRLADAVKFKVWTENGSAKAPADYSATTNTVTMTNLQYDAYVTIPVKDRGGVQGDRSFTVKISNLSETEAQQTSAMVTIEDVDNPYDKFDKQKPTDTGDETPATATKYAMLEFAQSGKTQDGTDRVLSNKDLNDWFAFTNALKSGCTYQVKVGDLGKRPATESGSPAVNFFYGLEKAKAGSSFARTTLDEIQAQGKWRFLVPSEQDGAVLYLQVTNTTQSTAIFNYNLEWREWVLPILSFETNKLSVTSRKGQEQTVEIPILRLNNLEEDIVAKVAVLSSDPRVKSVTNEVKFAKSTKPTLDDRLVTYMKLKIGGDDGLWAPDATFTVRILEDASIHLPPGKKAEHEMTVTIGTSMPERDELHGEPGNDGSQGAFELKMDRKPQMLTSLTLNGKDADDWYKFQVKGGKEYSFQVRNLVPGEDPASVPVVVSVSYPSADPTSPATTNLTIAALSEGLLKVSPALDGTAYVHFRKTGDTSACVVYDLVYREYVPSEVYLPVNAISVSEYASSVCIPVCAFMEVPLPMSVVVKTADGTAKAGEDYVALTTTVSWTEGELSEEQTNYVKYVNVDLKKTMAAYEGKETFNVLLDVSDSIAMLSEDRGYSRLTVTISDADKGAVGSFRIGEYVLGGVTNDFTSKAIAVEAGDPVSVRVFRDGNAGKVTATLKWSEGGRSATCVFGDLVTEKWVDLTVPASDGEYRARHNVKLSLTTDRKDAKVVRGTLAFSVTDKDTTLAGYAADLRNVPLTSSGNAWYVNASGDIVSKSLKSGESAAYKAKLKGPATLSFKCTNPELVTVSGGTLAKKSDGEVVISLAQGSKTVTVSVKATANATQVKISDIRYEPTTAFNRTGNFVGWVRDEDGIVGRANFTVSTKGKLSGKFTFAGNRVYSFSGTMTGGVSGEFRARRTNGDAMEGLVISIDEDGLFGIEQDGDDVGAGSRNGWSDRPLSGAFSGHAELLGDYQTASFALQADAEKAPSCGYASITVSKEGCAKFAGVRNGRSYTASATPFVVDDTGALAVVPALPEVTDGTVYLTRTNGAYALAMRDEVSVFTGATYDKTVAFDQLCASDGDAESCVLRADFRTVPEVSPIAFYFARASKAATLATAGRPISLRLTPKTGLFTGWVCDPEDPESSRHSTVRGILVSDWARLTEEESVTVTGGGYWKQLGGDKAYLPLEISTVK